MSYPVQLQENETVVRVIRRHPFSLIGRIIATVIIWIIGIFLWQWLRTIGGGMQTVADILMAAGTVFAIGYIGVYWYRYQNDLWLVTSQRLIDSTKTTPFNQDVKTANLANIQDINIRKHGIFQTMLEYGDVICQTASAAGRTFEFVGVAKPAEILDLIDDQRTLAMRGGQAPAPGVTQG